MLNVLLDVVMYIFLCAADRLYHILFHVLVSWLMWIVLRRPKLIHIGACLGGCIGHTCRSLSGICFLHTCWSLSGDVFSSTCWSLCWGIVVTIHVGACLGDVSSRYMCNGRRRGAGAEPGPPLRRSVGEDAAERSRWVLVVFRYFNRWSYSLCLVSVSHSGGRMTIYPRPRRAARGAMADWSSKSLWRGLLGVFQLPSRHVLYHTKSFCLGIYPFIITSITLSLTWLTSRLS